jgi:hypothetical protein
VSILSFTGGTSAEIITLSNINSTAFNTNFGISFALGAGNDTLNLGGSIALKGAGTFNAIGSSTGIDQINLGSGSDLTLTSVSGAINLAPAGLSGNFITLNNNATINSTSGDVTLLSSTSGDNIAGASKNLTINSGSGKATVANTINALGNLNITTTNATSSAISLAVVTAGDVSLTGAGDVSVTGIVTAASVNAKSSTGDVIFGNTLTTSAVGGFTSEATDATKATRIANVVDVLNGANALVTGNLIANNLNLAAIGTALNGTINITGKVDAATSGNNFTMLALDGAITIGGAVGSGPNAIGTLNVGGRGVFLASDTVAARNIDIGRSLSFNTSVTFAKTIESTIPNGNIYIKSGNGNIIVTGAITGKNLVEITTTGSGSITLNGAVSNDSSNGLIIIESSTGNVVTSGPISTSGSIASIIIDTATSGNVTINGNVSTSGGGDILLGIDLNGGSVTGTGNITINGTVTTTGAGAGDIILGVSNGSAAVNQAITAGPTGKVLFVNNVATDSFTIASGANISAGDDIFDDNVTAAGIINLGANITAFNDTSSQGLQGIDFDNSINLTGAVSIKAVGTGADITLASVNGAQNLTLETPAVVGSTITLASVGQTTALNTVTVTNSGDVLFNGAFTAANVVLLDTNDAVIFNGQTVISNSLTTTVEAYDVTFNVGQTVVLNGAPVFLNTGDVQFFGTNTVLPSGATIAGGSLADVSLAGTIISGGAFNIGAGLSNIYISNNTQLILNSTIAGSTFASLINLNAGSVGSFNLLGVGTLTLSANSTAGVTTGDIINVTNGTLNVTGTLGSASTITLTNGTLTGPGGTVGILAPAVGTVAPGGTLKTADVTFNAATNYSAAVLTPTTASNLEVGSSNSINLGGATLALSSVASGLAVGNAFTIINNTNSTAVTGTFAGLPEGSSVSAKDASGNTVAFTISYIGGTGANDVTLTVASVTPSQPATPQPMVAGQPALNKFTAIGADAGGGPLVTITFANGTYTSFFAYASSFTGGVRVALGDINGDGSTDVITGAGPGGGPQVNVYSVNTLSGVVTLQSSFFAFSAPSFTGGVYVAAGNANGDFYDDVIVGAGATGGSRVQVYAGSATGVVTSSTLNDFFAYSPAFTGGVVVAAGDRNADFDDEVITAPASNGGYNIKSFDCNGTGNSPIVVDNFFAFNDTTSVGGLSLAVGYFNSGGVADLVVGTSNAGYGVILDSATSGIAGVPFEDFTGAIRAGVAEDSTGQDYAVALAGPTGGPRVSVFSVGATSLTETDNLFVMNPSFTGGLFGTPTLADNVI